MTSALHKRLQRLEELVAARVAPPIWRFMWDANGDTAAELDRMVAAGEVAEKDRGRIQIWRWMNDAEALAAGVVHPESPAPKPAPALPAPPELKLLPAPAEGASGPSTSADTIKPHTEQQPSLELGPKRTLTEEQMRKWLDARDRPFGKPIRYPKGMATP
jgi:hypothetical protein